MRPSSFQRIDVGMSREVNSKYDDIKKVADSIGGVVALSEDLVNVDTVAAISTDITTVGSISSDVTAVSANNADVSTVAGDIANVSTVAGDSLAITTVASTKPAIDSLYMDKATLDSLYADKLTLDGVYADKLQIDTVAADITNVNTVATSIDDVGTVATNVVGVNTVATDIGNVNIVAADKVNVDTVATDITNVTAVATNITNVNNVAANKANVDTVASGMADVGVVATNVVDVSTVASNVSDVNTVAGGIVDVNSYANTYYHSLDVAPTIDTHPTLTEGDMYFDTVLKEMRVYEGTVWKKAGSTVNGTTARQAFTGDGVTTSFSVTGGYDAGYADVYLNGYKLLNGTDVYITSGTDAVFTTAPADGDVIDFIGYGAFEVADTYSRADIDAGMVVLDGIKGVDGIGSGLDADLLGGISYASYMKKGTNLVDGTDLDTVTSDGMYVWAGVSITNSPNVAMYGHMIVSNNAQPTQIVFSTTDGSSDGSSFMAIRRMSGGTWDAWDIFYSGSGVGGNGYAWVDEAANRTEGTTYTNTNGKPIMVCISGITDENNSTKVSVDGAIINSSYHRTTSAGRSPLSAIVPDGSTYLLTSPLGFLEWQELK